MEESVLKALLEEGITAAKAGQKEQARQRLMQVVEADENNGQAWLWLSGVVESLEDKQVCLENVLALNPDSGPAKQGLAWVAQQQAERGLPPALPPTAPTPVTSTSPEPEPPLPPDFLSAPAPPTSAIPSAKGPPDQVVAPPAQPPSAPTLAVTPTPAVRPERRRKRESRSGGLWCLSIGWGLYGLLSIVLGGLGFFSFPLVRTVLENPDLPTELRPDQIETLMALAEMGPLVGTSYVVFGGLCIALTVGLLMRHKVAFYASFVIAVLSFGFFFYVAIKYGGGCFCWPLAPIVFLGLTLLARDDFATEDVALEEERAKYAPGSPHDHYNRGAAYARQKKLGLVIREWERAVELAPDNVRFRNALALAYARQGQKEKAITLLEETLALAPDDEETKSNLKAVQQG